MPDGFDPQALRAFRDRDWSSAREAKERFWAEDHRRRGPHAGWDVGAALWVHTRSLDPTWPGPEQRADDLAHHIELSFRLQRLAHTLAELKRRVRR